MRRCRRSCLQVDGSHIPSSLRHCTNPLKVSAIASLGLPLLGAIHSALKSVFHGNSTAALATLPAANVGANLNLTSSQLNFLAGNLGNFSNLTINVGGRTEVVSLSTKLTAAEDVAVAQILTGGSQTISIGANGAATGGSISLNNSLLTALDNSGGGSIASMTVAHGLQVIDSVGALNISGKLTNYGSIQTASAASGSTDTISAGTVVNASKGSISSYSGNGNLVGSDVALNATNSLTNNGTISSANNLNITAPAINNTGLISAGSGNINVASAGALNVNGAGHLAGQ